MRFWVYIPPNNRNVPPMSLLKMSCKTANFLLLEGRYITGAEHKEKPANPVVSRVYEPFGVVPVVGLEPTHPCG